MDSNFTWTKRSKLNTALLIILVALAAVALLLMLENKEIYEGNLEKEISKFKDEK